ncbi:universal stress protein [Sphingorhabdus soli]|uniref:Universal stress protein n=1 Tax=Flavisphingopyxis soli TaxID=2601267 RepID=A0A5C6UB99_9SPHN|nr:universal stress protein [Sphingorhabdus soli]TXC69165.1 universal stress protein [Sphingorhabdus soli]
MVATDLTQRSEAPFARAISLAHQLGGEIIVAHVVAPGSRSDRDIVERKMADLIDRQSAGAGVPIAAKVLQGSVPSALAEAAQQCGCDLIVTGIARYNSMGDHILGTAVDHLVRHSKLPVLIVKNTPGRNYDHLLVATDLSNCSRHALVYAAEMFADPRIDLVHVYHVAYKPVLSSKLVAIDVQAEAEEELQAFIDDPTIPADVRSRVNAKAVRGDLTEVIDQRMRADDIDLLVLGTHGRSGLVHAMIGSRAAELLSWVPSDVLMIRESS